jgi:hypothetical protein
MTIEFKPWPKIPRYRREVCLTEKLDGTNACIRWEPFDATGSFDNLLATHMLQDQHGVELGHYGLYAQSRSKFVTPGKNTDNYGFAKWVQDNATDLELLGPGEHYGEWWGQGIQRGYGLAQKRFSLFNVGRWGAERQTPPACCHVVPVLASCQPSDIQKTLDALKLYGSSAAPGFMNPEGIVVYHSQSKQMYKILLEGDDIPKGQQ